jgi:hypothetical protein
MTIAAIAKHFRFASNQTATECLKFKDVHFKVNLIREAINAKGSRGEEGSILWFRWGRPLATSADDQ